MIASAPGDANSFRIGVTALVSAPGIRVIRTKRIPKVFGRDPKCRASLVLFAPRFEGAAERQIRASKVPGRSLRFVSIAQNAYRARGIRLCGLQTAQLKSYAGPINQKLRQPVR